MGSDDRQHDRSVSVAIVGATGYAGGELLRILAAHPQVEIAGVVGRGRQREPIGRSQPHLADTGQVVDAAMPKADCVFLALPHGEAAAIVPGLLEKGTAVIDLGPDFRLRRAADYPTWYGFEHPCPPLLDRSIYGLPELHRSELVAAARGSEAALVGSPGCYPTASLLAIAPLARAGLIADLVVDAKSGVSGAGREARREYLYAEVNENVRAYGLGGHRHSAEIEQELEWLGATDALAAGVTFLPHLVPMTRGILSTAHVRPARPIDQAELDSLYRDFYAGEPFVRVVDEPPETKHVLGSNACRVHVRLQERTGRIVALAVIDNLVKGAAGQAVQSFNLVHSLSETAGLGQLPLAP